MVVLNYWAVWCGPCKAELPMIDAYVRKLGGDDLKVFAVTVDDTVSDGQLKPLASVLSFPLVTRIDSMSYGTIDGAGSMVAYDAWITDGDPARLQAIEATGEFQHVGVADEV